jgi:hypothetical protein
MGSWTYTVLCRRQGGPPTISSKGYSVCAPRQRNRAIISIRRGPVPSPIAMLRLAAGGREKRRRRRRTDPRGKARARRSPLRNRSVHAASAACNRRCCGYRQAKGTGRPRDGCASIRRSEDCGGTSRRSRAVRPVRRGDTNSGCDGRRAEVPCVRRFILVDKEALKSANVGRPEEGGRAGGG